MKTFVALLTALCVAAGATSVTAQQPISSGGLGDRLCGPNQLSGQYECVTSAPLSEEETRVSMAYLAAPRPRHDPGRSPIDVAAAGGAAQHKASRD